MRLSKKKRIRRKQVKRIQQKAISSAIQTIAWAFEIAAKLIAYRKAQAAAACKFPAGGIMFKEALPNFGKVGDEFVMTAEKVIGKGAVESVMFGSPLNAGKGWFEEAGEITDDAISKIMARRKEYAENARTQITIDPDLKPEFIVTSKGFKEFHQQTES